MSIWTGRRPIWIALLAQIGAALGVLGVSHAVFALSGEDLSGPAKLALASAIAGALALLLKAGPVWAAFLALLPVAFVGTLWLALPVWVPALSFILLLLLLGNSLIERVPLYLSNRETMEALIQWLPEDKPVQAVDLGCGLADVPLALARHNTHPDSRFEGVENAPIPFLVARLRSIGARDARITIRWGSLWNENLSRFDMVYAFLSPHPMPRLFQKAEKEMRSGAVFVSNSFSVPDHSADLEIPIKSGRSTALLIWHMKDGGKR